MDITTLSTALEDVMHGLADADVSSFESGALLHPSWATPIVGLASAAETNEDWETAYELWTHARLLIPHSDEVKNGIARAVVRLMRSNLPGTVASRLTKTVSDNPSEITSDVVDESSSEDSETVTETVDSDANIDVAELPSSESEQARPMPEGPAPLVQPFEFDLTEFEVDAASVGAVATGSEQPTVDSEAAAADEIPDTSPGDTSSDTAIDELDQLIGRLEGARIVPREDSAAVPVPNLEDDIGNIASETLATIYLDQEQFAEAADVYDRLAEQHPDRAEEFSSRAQDARSKGTD